MAESAAAAHQAPVQALHPHWQVAIEDTSPMNLCVRREAHVFLGGFPDGDSDKFLAWLIGAIGPFGCDLACSPLKLLWWASSQLQPEICNSPP